MSHTGFAAVGKIVAGALLAIAGSVSGGSQATPGHPPATWPIAPVVVVRPFEAPPSAYGAGHRGVDLAARVGQPIVSAMAGVVTVAGQVAGRPVVVVEHGGGIRTTYLPVTPEVSLGQQVSGGEEIGRIAPASHCLLATCLHWGARDGDTYIDPRTLLDGGQIVLLPLTEPTPH